MSKFYKRQFHPRWDVDQRVLLYQRADSPKDTWYCRIKRTLGGRPYLQRSLKTGNQWEAEKKAHELYKDLMVAERQGVLLGDESFESLFPRFIRSRAWGDDRKKRIWHTFTAYFQPFFGKRSVKEIEHAVWGDYLHWRWGYWSQREVEARSGGQPLPFHYRLHPSANTLRSERQILIQFLRWCYDPQKIIPRVPLLTHEFHLVGIQPKQEKAHGKPIHEAQFLRILEQMRIWSGLDIIRHGLKAHPDAPWEAFRGRNLVNPHTTGMMVKSRKRADQWAYLRMYHFVMLVGHLLLRPGTEATGIRWRDVRFITTPSGTKAGAIQILHGKKGARAEPVLTPEGLAYQNLVEWKFIANSFGAALPHHFVFGSLPKIESGPNEEVPAHYISRLHSRFLKQIGESQHEDDRDTKITLYSYRHTAICRRIEKTTQTPLEVAKAANTSLATISNSYAASWVMRNADRYVNLHPDRNQAAQVERARRDGCLNPKPLTMCEMEARLGIPQI